MTLRDADGKTSLRLRSRPLVKRLNALWRSHDALHLVVTPAAPGRARIEEAEGTLIEVLPADAAGRDPLAVARTWANAAADAFRRRGRDAAVDESGAMR